MNTLHPTNVDIGKLSSHIPPSAETFDLVSAHLGQSFAQQLSIDQDLTKLVYEVEYQVALEHTHFLQRSFLKSE